MNYRSKYLYYLSSVFKLLTGMKPWPRVVRVFLRLKPDQKVEVELPAQGVRFRARGPMDLWSLKETFLDRFYEVYGTPVQDGWCMIDIGGGIGDFTVFAAHRRPNARVYAFEPTPESFALLEENLHRNKVTNVQAYGEAVWSSTGSLAIDTTTGEPGQYISRQPGESTPVGRVQVPSVSLEDLFNRLGLERCDLMKMDCEGAEYPILFNAPEAVLSRIQRLVMETHDNVSKHSHHDLARFLSERGFHVKIWPNPVHDYLGYLYAERVPPASA